VKKSETTTTQDRDGLANNALLQREPTESLRSVLTTGSPDISGGYSPTALIVLENWYFGKEGERASSIPLNMTRAMRL
jgi:hypothetical protein